MNKKTTTLWLDGVAPTSGFELNKKGRAAISTYIVYVIQENIRNTKFISTYDLVTLPPVPSNTPPITSIVTTDSKSSGQYFVRI